jgi:hypothetical protein
MTLLVPNGGEAIVLNYLTNKDAPENLVVRLYQNDYTPVAGSVIGDFTEATFTGYAEEVTSGGDWTVTPGDPSVAEAGEIAFTSTAGSQDEDIYGYYVVRETSEDLVYAERFPLGPYTIVNNGHEIRVTPRIQLSNAA